jgi:hypothetical protein
MGGRGVTIADVISASSSLAVAVFAFVQWKDLVDRSALAEREANERASARAVGLRMELRQVFPRQKESSESFDRWFRHSYDAQLLLSTLDRWETLARQMVEDLSGGSPAVRREALGAYVLLSDACMRLRLHTSRPRPNGPELFDWHHLKTGALAGLFSALSILEASVIGRAAMTDIRFVEATSEAEHPIQHLIADLSDEPSS